MYETVMLLLCVGGYNMRVIILEPNKDPVWAQIENDSESIKAIVGGESMITPILIRDAVIITDNDAKLKNKSVNFYTEKDIIAGDVILAGMKGEELVDISDDQAKAFFAVYFPDFHLHPAYKLLFE